MSKHPVSPALCPPWCVVDSDEHLDDPGHLSPDWISPAVPAPLVLAAVQEPGRAPRISLSAGERLIGHLSPWELRRFIDTAHALLDTIEPDGPAPDLPIRDQDGNQRDEAHDVL